MLAYSVIVRSDIMIYTSVIISFITQLLGVAASDTSLSSQEYETIKNFLEKEINRLRECDNVNN